MTLVCFTARSRAPKQARLGARRPDRPTRRPDSGAASGPSRITSLARPSRRKRRGKRSTEGVACRVGPHRDCSAKSCGVGPLGQRRPADPAFADVAMNWHFRSGKHRSRGEMDSERSSLDSLKKGALWSSFMPFECEPICG